MWNFDQKRYISLTLQILHKWYNYVDVNHGYSNEFFDSDRTVNVYFISDIDAKDRIWSLNEFSKRNLNEMRGTSMHDDGVFNDCQFIDQEFDDEIASIDSQTSMMDHNVSNDLIDCQLNSKDDDDDDDN